MRRQLFFIYFLLVTPIYADVYDNYSFASSSETQRFTRLTKEIRCVVCQNQSLADSNAPLANDLRAKIYHLMLEKQSDAEIKAYLVKRYGEFILLRPPFNQLTVLLWLFPLLGLLLGMIVLFRWAKLEKF